MCSNCRNPAYFFQLPFPSADSPTHKTFLFLLLLFFLFIGRDHSFSFSCLSSSEDFSDPVDNHSYEDWAYGLFPSSFSHESFFDLPINFTRQVVFVFASDLPTPFVGRLLPWKFTSLAQILSTTSQGSHFSVSQMKKFYFGSLIRSLFSPSSPFLFFTSSNFGRNTKAIVTTQFEPHIHV